MTRPVNTNERTAEVANSSANGSISDVESLGEKRRLSLAEHLFRYDYLDRKLRRPHITGIAFSGTVGVGLFVTSGELIGFSGPLGCVLGFLIAGLIVVGVMRCLAEMVSVRPIHGALIDYPKTFVDDALGFAVGVTYWFSQCISMVVLTSAAARTANWFHPHKIFNPAQKAGIVTGLLVITLISNICGVRLYGNLERFVKQIKFLTILALCVLMIVINVNREGSSDPHESNAPIIIQKPFPPGFPFGRVEKDVTAKDIEGVGIPGTSGTFLAIWTSITLAMFACQGGDIVIVSAGEAERPRTDLPKVTRFMYLVPLSCYVLGSFLVGLNVGWWQQGLARPWLADAAKHALPSSPFIKALHNSSLAPHITKPLFQALILFAAYTCSNTALYASSRTLFSLARLYGNEFIKDTIGKTGSGHTPIAAILVSWLFGGLAYLVLIGNSFSQPILSLSAFFTSAVACVYASQCIAFLRFLKGLRRLGEVGYMSRDERRYVEHFRCYRAHWQPFFALFGLVGCIIIVIFSGWPSIYLLTVRDQLDIGTDLKSNIDLAWDMIGAYAGPIIFLALYGFFKLTRNTKVVDLEPSEIAGWYRLEITDAVELEEPVTKNWKYYLLEVWSFIK